MATQLRFAKLHLKNHRTSGAMTSGDIKYDKNADITTDEHPTQHISKHLTPAVKHSGRGVS